LGIGLHSYGRTHGIVEALVIFALTQLLIIGVGLIPQSKWLSSRSAPAPA
jgi:hypothetical protein